MKSTEQGSEARTCDPLVSSQALSHCAPIRSKKRIKWQNFCQTIMTMDLFQLGTVSGSGTGPLDYGSGTGHRATPIRTVSGSGSLRNNYSARLGIRGCVSVPARICSNCYFTNKNSCWSFTLLRPPSLINCLYCQTIQTSISLYKRYIIFNGQEWKKT